MPFSEYMNFYEEKKQLKETNELHEQIGVLSKTTQKRVNEFLAVLKESGVKVSSGGYLKHELFQEKIFILPYILYCLSGRNKPEHYTSFLELIRSISIPKGLLCARVSRDAKIKIKKK